MADDLKDFIDILKCPVCLDLLNIPYRLPCSHVCCKSCLEQIIQHRRNNHQNRNTITCPQCRRSIILKKGISDFKKDLLTSSMVEAILRRKSRKKKITRPCEIHNKPEDIFCRTCNLIVCSSCAFSETHKGHNRVNAEKAEEKGKEYISRMIEEISECHIDGEKQIEECEKHLESIKVQASEIWHDMEKKFSQMIQNLEERQKELNGWLEKQLETCESTNRTYIARQKENMETLNQFKQTLEEALKEDMVTFIKGFKGLRERALDFLENERKRQFPPFFAADALSDVEFKCAPWRLSYTGNVEDIELHGSVKCQTEYIGNRLQNAGLQTINLEVTNIQKQLLSNSGIVRAMIERDLKEKNALVEWPFSFTDEIKVINKTREQRPNFKEEIGLTVAIFFKNYTVKEIDFEEIRFRWVQSRVEFIQKEMEKIEDLFALSWSAYDVTIISSNLLINRLEDKLRNLMLPSND